MSGERDPRVDPRPGDVVRVPCGCEWLVISALDGWVRCTDRISGGTLRDTMLVETWRIRYADAEIVKVAE
jgi:hypothetical protein